MKTSKSGKKNAGNEIRSSFFNNFKVKLLCFFLAILMYFSISIFQRSTKIYNTNLRIDNLKDYLVIANRIPETIRIIAKDKKDVFDKISEEDFNVHLDLSKVSVGTKSKAKLEWDVPKNMNSFFSSVKIEPAEIEVKVENLVEKNVSIIMNFVGDPAEGYVEKSSYVEPSVVRIQGPESIVSQIDNVKTETINIEGIRESFRREVKLVSDYPMVKILGDANIYFEIIEETDVVSFSFNKAIFQNLKEQFAARLESPVEVSLKGPKSAISNVTKGDFDLIVDCANIAFPGEYSYEVNVKSPKDFTIISKKPERVKIIVEDKK